MRKPNSAVFFLILAIIGVLAAKQFVKRNSEPHSTAPANTLANIVPAVPSALLTGAQFDSSLKSGRPTMAEFGKGTCQVCISMAPILKQTAKDYTGKANIVSVDLDDNPELGHTYRVMTMPTQVFSDAKGKEVSRHVGYMEGKEIALQLDRIINNSSF